MISISVFEFIAFERVERVGEHPGGNDLIERRGKVRKRMGRAVDEREGKFDPLGRGRDAAGQDRIRRQREIGRRDPEIMGDRTEKQPKALPNPHAEGQQQGGSNENQPSPFWAR